MKDDKAAFKITPPSQTQEPSSRLSHTFSHTPDEIQIITFFLDSEEYGLIINQVKEVDRVQSISQLPDTVEYVVGIINLRGQVIPIIDLKQRFKLGHITITHNSRIIIVEVGKHFFGLLVDSVSQVQSINKEKIQNVTEGTFRAEARFMSGICHLDKRLVMLLNLATIFRR